ncbi:MAG TPA: hypothetical protein VG425_05585 [Casimicrobiaceae bacterium]|jgi:hypothetical protein|nr:hypothetical protein [Casimicrobiaceae bacterium]
MFIILVHPDPRPQRLCRALAATYVQGATEEGHEVKAERLVFVFPIWLGMMHAPLKALFAQALRPGFAIEQNSPGRRRKQLRCGDARALARRARTTRRSNAARPSPLRCLRLSLGLPLAVALYGCATVVVPTQVRFASLRPSPESVQMVDARPGYAREYREQGGSQTFRFFADDAMQPNAVDLVSSRIAAALPASERGRPVELRRLDIGFLVSPRSLLPGSSDVSIALPSGTPAGAIAAGLLLAYGMIAAFHGPRTNESGVAYIEVAIGADALRTAQTVSVAHSVGAAEAVETAFASALDDLAEQARGLTPRAPSVP